MASARLQDWRDVGFAGPYLADEVVEAAEVLSTSILLVPKKQ